MAIVIIIYMLLYEKLGNNTQTIECYTRSIKLCRNAGYMTGLKNVLRNFSDLYFREIMNEVINY